MQLLEGLYGTADGTIHDTYTHTALGLGAYTRDGVRTTIVRDPEGRPITVDTLGGARHILHTDPQGTVHALLTPEGQVAGTYTYTPYGEPTPTGQAAVDNPLHWLGMLQDPHGRYHLGHRYYHPQHARFTQPDPSGQELNPYTYASGDPINQSDSIGLAPPLIAAALALFGAAIYGCIVGALADLFKESITRQVQGRPQIRSGEINEILANGCLWGGPISVVLRFSKNAILGAARWAYSRVMAGQ
ncbi:RHS repeat-associated core domain-containing protein [Bounagaea algeriensis]